MFWGGQKETLGRKGLWIKTVVYVLVKLFHKSGHIHHFWSFNGSTFWRTSRSYQLEVRTYIAGHDNKFCMVLGYYLRHNYCQHLSEILDIQEINLHRTNFTQSSQCFKKVWSEKKAWKKSLVLEEKKLFIWSG